VVSITDQQLFEVVDPGTYSIDHDGLADTPLRVLFTIEAEGWRGWVGTYKDEEGEDAESRVVGLTIGAASEVVADPCHEHRWVDPGPTVDDLATALASLPGFELTAPVSDVSAYGYEGKHLELQVPDLEHNGNDPGFVDCTEGYFYGWRAFTAHQRTLHRYYQGPHEIVEFWILDVEGSRLLIETNRFPNSPANDVVELSAILDSIRIEP
jgi:hypothetical protein